MAYNIYFHFLNPFFWFIKSNKFYNKNLPFAIYFTKEVAKLLQNAYKLNAITIKSGELFTVVGMVLSISWMQILISYGRLNSSKIKIICIIEKHLPASLYDAEWAALDNKLNKKKYISFTDSEKRVPTIFLVIYAVIFLVLLTILIYNFSLGNINF